MMRAIDALGLFGSHGKVALNALCYIAAAGPIRDRSRAAEAILRIDPKNELPFRVIRALLQDKDGFVRSTAVVVILNIGQEEGMHVFVPDLIVSLNDTNQAIVMYSIVALHKLHKDAKSAIPFLKDIADNPNRSDEVRKLAKNALREIENSP